MERVYSVSNLDSIFRGGEFLFEAGFDGRYVSVYVFFGFIDV